MYRFSL